MNHNFFAPPSYFGFCKRGRGRVIGDQKAEEPELAEMSAKSSSSRREIRSESHHIVAKKIGCMSGLFHLLQNHHRLRRKRIASASSTEKKEKTIIISPPPQSNPPPLSPPDKNATETKQPPENHPSEADTRRLTCDLPRSPTLPKGIRRYNTVHSSGSLRQQPALVARLMGLDDMPPSPESSAEKRRKLLGAIQKCDEDLKALKKIIDAVQVAGDHKKLEEDQRGSLLRGAGLGRQRWLGLEVLGERRKVSSSKPWSGGGDNFTAEEKMCTDVGADQPSPVSVLDEIDSSPSHRSSSRSLEKVEACQLKGITCSSFHKTMEEPLPRFPLQKGYKSMELFSSVSKVIRRQSASKAVVETVNDLCRDESWGVRWEVRRMGAVIEVHILGELVEEIVRELVCYLHDWALPWEGCRRRLCF